ncbi:hypothetical protein AAMO2058_000559700 [Amorphochlora amoebiformis]|mmetsp:Transcript_9692/g.15324  ORF Transcript_9692/g.15324 Transcript_9692/m.15324 type:complete len:806 (-) Transcript_9692:161-2578(-)
MDHTAQVTPILAQTLPGPGKANVGDEQLMDGKSYNGLSHTSLLKLGRQNDGWKDITEKLKKASKGMKIGTMIHGPDFSLYDAMSALELMDPKMDPGMKQKNSEGKEVDFKHLDPKTVRMDLSLPELIAVMDQCLAFYVSWCNGQTLCHTVLTCVYTHPEFLEREGIPLPLSAFMHCLLKLCHMVRNVVMRADIYEEEDFTANVFGFELDSKTPDLKVLMSLEAAMVEFAPLSDRKRRKKSKSTTDNTNSTADKTNTIPALQTDSKTEAQALLKRGVHSRLEFIRSMWKMHQALSERKAKEASALLNQTEQMLSTMRLTQKLASQTAPGFDPLLPRLIVPHIPPRVVKTPNSLETTVYFISLLKHLKRTLILDGGIKTLEDTIEYVKGVSVECPGIVARSHLLILLNTVDDLMGMGPMTKQIRESFFRFCPGTFRMANADADMDVFLDRVAKPVSHILRLFCENRARQRRKIGKLLLDMAILQSDSTVLDRRCVREMQESGMDLHKSDTPYRHPCFGWVLDLTLQLLSHHIQLGFELELFAPREYAPCLWYLEYLLKCRLENSSFSKQPVAPKWKKKFDQLVLKRQMEMKSGSIKSEGGGSARSGGGGGGSRKKRSGNRKKAKKNSARPQVTSEIILIQARKDLARGTYKAIQGLLKTGVLSYPPPPFGSEKLSFQHRFAEFLKVPQPVVLGYEDYQTFNDLKKTNINALTTAAHQALENAKIMIKEAQNRAQLLPPDLLRCRQLLKVAVGNSVCNLMIRQALQKPPPGAKKPATNPTLKGYRVEFDITTHRSFPMIKLVKAVPKP